MSRLLTLALIGLVVAGCLEEAGPKTETVDGAPVASTSDAAPAQSTSEAAAPSTSQAPPPEPTQTVEPAATGSITGTVMMADELLPIPNATVQLITNSGQGTLASAAGTGQDGKYTFLGVAAGTYEVYAVADGYDPIGHKVDVADGQSVTGIDLLMTAAPVVGGTGYYSTLQKNGLIGCSVAVPAAPFGFPPCRIFTALTEIGGPDLSDLDASELRFFYTGIPVDLWTATVFEMTWQRATVGSAAMTFSWGTPGCHDCSFGSGTGSSPLKLVADRATMDTAFGGAPPEDFGADHGSFFSESNIAATGTQPGVAAQQAYTQYVTAFFGAEPPATFTATVDT